MIVETEKTVAGTSTSVPADRAASTSISRRTLLRGASAAVPTILTLQSGAALAQSSNLIGTTQDVNNAIGEGGNVQCLDMASAVDGTPTKLDLGPNPSLHVQYVSQRQYYRTTDTNQPVDVKEMCERGGTYWYEDGGWQHTQSSGNGIQAGFLVSATALSSFASAIQMKTYF